ncbi:proline and serine-rich protein 3 [Stigmatopora argus]
MRKTSFSQVRTKVLPNKRNKQSLIPVRSHQQDLPQVHTSDNHRAPFFTNSGPSTDHVYPPTTVSSQPGMNQDSALTKYIDRFRYGQPLSREDRQQLSSEFEEERIPLWWMSSSSFPPSSTPTKSPHKDNHNQAISSPARCQFEDDFNSSPRNKEYDMNAYIPSDTSQCEFEETEIIHLQERASKLLQETILSNGSLPVRSDRQGSSNWCSPVNINERVQGRLINTSIKSTAGNTKLDSAPTVPLQRYTVPSVLTPPSHPEQDILSQWRLRRKMEQAQQDSRLFTSTFSNPGPSLITSSIYGQPYMQQPCIPYPEPLEGAFAEPKLVQGLQRSTSVPKAIAVSETLVSQPHSLAHVPAHMHLLCDILPCPTPSSHAGMFQRNPQHLEEICTKGNNSSRNVKYIDEPPHRCIPSSPPAPSQYTDVPCPVRPSDRGHPCRLREVGSPSRLLERGISSRHREGGSASRALEGGSPSRAFVGGSPSRLTKIDHSSNSIEEPNLSRRTEEQSQIRPTAGFHHENPRMANEMAEKEKTPNNHVRESKTARIIRKKKKSTRSTKCTEDSDGPNATSSAHQKLLKKTKNREDQRKAERHKDTGNHAPLSSAIQCALGQVVSEVLFTPVDSSPQDAVVPSLHTLPQPKPLRPSCTTHTSLEVMSQLLRKAEDSDEKEFEDDPLLKVLRKQRKSVQEQISEVNFMLHNILDQ